MTHVTDESTNDHVDEYADESSDDSTELLDEEWLTAPKRRSRLRNVLAVLLAASLVFLAGVEVQRKFGASSSSASTAAGGLPGLGGAGGALPSGFPGGGAQGTAPDSSGGSGPADASAVIGTVQSVKGDVWTIKDLGGTVHKVTVSATVRVVRESAVAATDVEAGATVDVTGTADDAGAVTATTITIR